MSRISAIPIKVLFICLLLSFAVQCCAAATVTVSIEDITVDPGEVVTVPIKIDGIEDYGTGTINIEYDPAVVAVTDVTDSSDSTVPAYNIRNSEHEEPEGYVSISAWNMNGVSGDIVFADVQIMAVGNSGDSTSLTLTVDTLQDISSDEIPVNLISGSFKIAGQASADPTPTQTSAANEGEGGTSQTPPDDGTEVSPTSASPSDEETHHESYDAEADNSAPTNPDGADEAYSKPLSDAASTPKKPSSTIPGFGGVLLISGLLTAYLIARLRF